jgi:hypothetical protein
MEWMSACNALLTIKIVQNLDYEIYLFFELNRSFVLLFLANLVLSYFLEKIGGEKAGVIRL